jgi:hypothetical protein
MMTMVLRGVVPDYAGEWTELEQLGQHSRFHPV